MVSNLNNRVEVVEFSKCIFVRFMRYIPHILTSGNLFCGTLAIGLISKGLLIEATWLVFIAGILDFFDGFAARLFKVAGDFGKQLDSLADVVTFGVVPAFLLYKISLQLLAWPFKLDAPSFLVYVPLLIAVFSALRLAKFNIDENQTDSFIGVPTPANAFWLCGIPYVLKANPEIIGINQWISPYTLAFLALCSCFLLVAPVRMLSLKLKTMAWTGNETLYLLLVSIGISLAVFKFAGLLTIVPLYILFSIIHNRLYTNEIRS